MALPAQPTYSQWLKENPDVMEAMGPSAPAPPPQPQETTYAKWDAPAPQPQPITVNVQTAPTVQAPAPGYQAPAPPPPVVIPKAKAPIAGLRQVQGQQIDSANQVASSFIREGDEKAKASQQKAGVLKEHVGTANRYAAAADRNHDDNQIAQGEMKAWMMEDLRKLREPPEEPERWKKAVGTLNAIVLGTAGGYLGRLGGGLQYGIDAMNDWVNKGVNEQLQEQDQADANLERTGKAFKTLSDDSANESDIAHKLVANHWLAASAELERIGEEAKVPELKENAFRLAHESRQRGLSVVEKNLKEQMADARAAQAARMKLLSAKPDWGNVKLPILEELERRNELPPDGLNALNEMRKKARDAQGLDDPKGIVQNPQIEGLSVIPGSTITKDGFTEAQKAKRMLDKVQQHLTRAKELATVETGLYPYGNDRLKVEGQYAGQRASALALISQLVEAGVLNEGDAERFGQGMPEPDRLFTNDMDDASKAAVYDELLNNFRATGEDGLRTLGFEVNKPHFSADTTEPPPAAMSTPEAGPPAPPRAPQKRTTMYAPGTGEPIDVKASLLPQFEAQGFTYAPPGQSTDPAVSSPPPPPSLMEKRPEDMTDQEYAAYVLAMNGG